MYFANGKIYVYEHNFPKKRLQRKSNVSIIIILFLYENFILSFQLS